MTMEVRLVVFGRGVRGTTGSVAERMVIVIRMAAELRVSALDDALGGEEVWS